MPKFVLYHKPTESYMYAHSQDQMEALCDDMPDEIIDVTGQTHHEFMAQSQLGAFNEDANESAETSAIIEAASRGPVEIMPGVTLVVGDHIPDLLASLISGESAALGFSAAATTRKASGPEAGTLQRGADDLQSDSEAQPLPPSRPEGEGE